MTTIINRKKYTVDYVFNMVGNFYFTDKNGIQHLVDAEDVSIWCEENNKKHEGLKTAIAYAKELSMLSDGGCFWWKIK